MNYLGIDVERLIAGYQNVDDLVEFTHRNKRQRTTFIELFPEGQYFNLEGVVDTKFRVSHRTFEATLKRIHPTKQDEWKQIMALLTARTEKHVKFYTIMKPWGMELYRILSITLSAVCDKNGKIDHYTGFSNDISYEIYEKQQVMKERMRSEQLNTNYKISFWTYDPIARMIYSDNKVHDDFFHDYTEKEFLELHHPDYIRLATERLESFRQHKFDPNGYVMSLFTPDGTYHYYDVSPEPLMDADGNAVRYQFICRDVTEEKKEEFRMKTFAMHSHQIAIRSGIRTFFYEPGSRHVHIVDGYADESLKKIELKELLLQFPEEKRLQVHHFFAKCDAHIMTRTEFRIRFIPIGGNEMRLFRVLVMPVSNEKGQVVEYGLMCIDETEENEQQTMRRFIQRVGKIGGWTYNRYTNIIRMSEEACNIIGYPYNADNQIDLDEYARTFVVSEEREGFCSFIQKVIREHKDDVMTYHIKLPDGKLKCVEHRIHIAQDSENVSYTSYGTIMDVSEREKLESERYEAFDLLRTVLDALPISVFIKEVDQDFKLLMANKLYADYFGKNLDDIVGHPLRDFASPLLLQKLEEKDMEASKHTIDDPLIRITKEMFANGKDCYYQHTEFGYDLYGRKLLIGVSANVTDIQMAMEKAENSDRLKSAFLANMSHEIRTPLNAIVGFSELIANNVSPEENEQFMEIIHSNSDNLLRLIRDILDISKLEANAMQFCFSDFNVHDLLKEAYLSLQDRFESLHDVAFEYDFVNEVVPVHQDRVRVMEVLNNFLTNASKHTESGSVRMWAEVGEDQFKICVKDTGCGIPKDQQEEIFDRFQMVKGNRKEGTGLGLAISKQICDHLGGTIGVESEVGQGSLFWASFPINGKDCMV